MDESGSSKELLKGHENAKSFIQSSLKCIGEAIASANSLPSDKKDDWTFYSTFPRFREVMSSERDAIKDMINKVLAWNGIRAKCPNSDEEIIDFLSDVNNTLLEKINDNLDDAAGLKTNQDSAMLIEISQKSLGASGSWNKRLSLGKDQSELSLVTAKNIQRPQLLFKDKIDNSNNPFMPRLKEKPNSKKPLSILVEHGDDGEEFYSHPYLYELNLFNPKDDQLKKPTPKEPVQVQDTPVKFVDTLESLKQMLTTLKSQKEIAVDLEHHWYRSYQGITCLLQVSTLDQDFVIDPFPLWSDLTLLNEVFTDPKIVKVFHGADNDLMWLQRDFSVYVVNLFDTHQAAINLGFPQGTRKYSFLLDHYFKVKSDKRFQLADWRIRPLPSDMMTYARVDSHYLLPIYHKMKSALLEQGNEFKNLLMATINTGTDMCKRVYTKPKVKDSSHEDLVLKSKAHFNSRQMLAAHGIYQWRDKVARENDESDQFVLPNHMLLKICTELPREMQGILACCNPIPPLVKQDLQTLHMIILKARESPLTTTASVMSSMSPVKWDTGSGSGVTLTEVASDILKSPLDLSHVADLHGSCLLEETPKSHQAKKSVKVGLKKKPDLAFFTHRVTDQDEREEKPEGYLKVFQRYQMLQPYLKYLNEGGNAETLSAHAKEVHSIREHFDALTKMTADEFTKADTETEAKEEMNQDEDEEEDSEGPEHDEPVIKSIRAGVESKKFGKKRKGKNKSQHESPAAKRQRESFEGVNYTDQDFSQFSRPKRGGNPRAGQFDPWKNYAKDARGGKRKPKQRNKGQSMTYSKK